MVKRNSKVGNLPKMSKVGPSHATLEEKLAEGPANAVEEIEQEEDDGEEDGDTYVDGTEPSVQVSQSLITDIGGTSKNNGVRLRKRSRNGDFLANSVSEMVEAFKGFAEEAKFAMSHMASRIGHEVDVSASRCTIFGELSKLPNLTTDDIMRAASMLVNDTAKSDLFLIKSP
ncbi:hypothetical protein F0562_025387 [Nyssa sinensis]|uniref:Uncharacterized protein n=1 Tax=Nyssa sinensis TaxID=561372 RepID=A0A5J5BFB2_9ASTE|nr:hypothetical protein F0562_025387 [Nyssa sinensis]